MIHCTALSFQTAWKASLSIHHKGLFYTPIIAMFTIVCIVSTVDCPEPVNRAQAVSPGHLQPCVSSVQYVQTSADTRSTPCTCRQRGLDTIYGFAYLCPHWAGVKCPADIYTGLSTWLATDRRLDGLIGQDENTSDSTAAWHKNIWVLGHLADKYEVRINKHAQSRQHL